MLAAFEAACCAANGVPLRDPRNPSEPELFHDRTFPAGSLMVTMVLLKEAWICTTPWGTCLRSFFLKVFFFPFLSVAPVPPAAAGFAIFLQSSVSVLGPQSLTCGPVLCLCRRLLLLGDGAFAGTFAGARISMCTLAANRKVA